MRLVPCLPLCVATLLIVAGAAPAQKVSIKGSNTFGEELAPRLVEQYRAAQPEVEFALESKGTATGIAALLNGECDIAAASRLANEDELRLRRSRGIRMQSHSIGYYGVAVIVHARNPITNLSDAQVRCAFTGIINKWKAMGWDTEQPIRACIRHSDSGAHLGFQELALDRMPYARAAAPFRSYEEITDAVQADPNSIGYVSMLASKRPGIRGITVNGIPLTVQSVEEGTYPYARQLRLYTNPKRESAAAKDFIRFCQSREGQRIVEETGNVPRY
jgi:phosphate transport system substrate-binding protein